MNIKEAKDYVKNSINIYLKKDEFGDYRIPIERQRPIFLLGAPGIGKTAIMEQIASELGIALVSYSMTHHTRQSALGLPFITKKTYAGKEYDVSEYTMSEIIATIYDTMEESGVNEGILFLDEINCVSETLAPSMLQFLQYKTFGKHRVPSGWVIVTAGNPPEYNKSVREFDVVTMDRLKVLSVEADYDTWRRYGEERGIHRAILSFLEIKRDFFYHMETTAKGRTYVTARGWEDLSEIIKMHEEDGLKVDESLIGQYICSDKVTKEFCIYYELFNKYKRDYRIDEILNGTISEEARKAATAKVKAAEFDERLSIVSMLADKVQSLMREVMEMSDYLTLTMAPLKELKAAGDGASLEEELVKLIAKSEQTIRSLQIANALSPSDKTKHKKKIRFLNTVKDKANSGEVTSFNDVKAMFDAEVNGMKELVARTDAAISRMFKFVEAAFSDGNELLVLTTELTVNQYSSRFLGKYGNEDYRRISQKLMVSERQGMMLENIKKLEID